MKSLYIILISFFLFSFSSDYYMETYEKKINKELKRVFKLENLSISKSFIDKDVSLGPDNAFYEVKYSGEIIGYININRVNACRAGGCDRPNPFETARYDHFYYMAVFNKDLSILKVSVLDYQSEHGYEICSRNWLKQFVGSKEKPFAYNKNIDAISGATVSVNAIIDEINLLEQYINKIKERQNI